MTRKVIYISFAFFTLTLALAFLQSCKDLWTYKAKICDVEFTGIYPNSNNLPDEFTSEIGFVITTQNGDPTCFNLTNLNLIPPCCAMTKRAKWQNEIIISSFRLYADRQIIIAGDTIKANSDLFLNPFFKNGVTSQKDEDASKFIRIVIKLIPDLLTKTSFEQGVYNMTFNCSTTDGKLFTKKRSVVFKK